MNIRRTLRLGGLGFFAALTFIGVQPLSASAHYVYQSGYMYQDSWECVWGRSEVSHGTGNGFSRSDIQVEVDGPNGADCVDTLYRPVNYIRVRQIYLAQLTPGWAYCRDTGNLYNTTNTFLMTVKRTHSGKCGTTNYQTESIMHELNGSWKGGTIWSGTHWL
jgi:hypothetical protein